MSFLNGKRIGLLLRAFAAKEELVADQVEKVVEAAKTAARLHLSGERVFSRVDILVPDDQRFEDSDCGKTAKAILARLTAESPRDTDVAPIDIFAVKHGDIFCSLLNYGVAVHLNCDILYSAVLSSQAVSYLNEETALAIVNALEDGARAVGVALNELTDSILKGRIANTFAVWDNAALMTVGGFDLRARKPRKDDKLVPYLRGWSKEKEEKEGDGEVYYHQAGVEEIAPLIRLVELFGPCIAPILPRGDGVKQWVAPDPMKDPEGYARHLKKMGTKTERQTAHAMALGADLSYLEGGVMPKYRQK